MRTSGIRIYPQDVMYTNQRIRSRGVTMGQEVVVPEAIPVIRYKSEDGKLHDTKQVAVSWNRTSSIIKILGNRQFWVHDISSHLKELAEVYAMHPDA